MSKATLSNVGLLTLLLVLGACVSTQKPETIMSDKSAVELRAMQSRKFETGDAKKVYRAILATMLDLGYAVTSLEPEAGTLTGNKLAQLNLTASVSPIDDKMTSVRANAIVKVGMHEMVPPQQVDSAEFYQKRFFDPLAQALFLEALYEPATDPDEKEGEEVGESKKRNKNQ